MTPYSKLSSSSPLTDFFKTMMIIGGGEYAAASSPCKHLLSCQVGIEMGAGLFVGSPTSYSMETLMMLLLRRRRKGRVSKYLYVSSSWGIKSAPVLPVHWASKEVTLIGCQSIKKNVSVCSNKY
jgi:hypothetical protein